MENLRLGLVGCGNMMKHHISGVKLLDNVDITALCDSELERAENVAELFPDAFVTTDYREMTEHIDAILIALPHDLHYECGMFFANNGKHVLMEKPICNSEEECLKLIERCEEKKLTFMCAYPVPYMPAVVKLKELLDSGEFGAVMQMSIWTEQLTQNEELHWANTSRLGGGQFFSHGCHYVDILLRFLGNPVSGTHFGTRVGTPWMIKEGTSIASFKFENGALGYHGATWGARGTMLGALNMQVHTEKGMLEMTRGEVRLYDELEKHIPGQEADCNYKVLFKTDGFNGKHTNFEIEHFADCVLNGKTPMTSARSALQSLRIIWKMYEAEKNGTIADLRGMGIANI